MVYALLSAAEKLSAQDQAYVGFLVSAQDLKRELIESGSGTSFLGFPDSQRFLLTSQVEQLGELMKTLTGTNPLDVDDSTTWSGVGTADQHALLDGGLGDQAVLFGGDVKASAGELADGLKSAAGAAAAAAQRAVIYAAVAIALVLLAAWAWKRA